MLIGRVVQIGSAYANSSGAQFSGSQCQYKGQQRTGTISDTLWSTTTPESSPKESNEEGPGQTSMDRVIWPYPRRHSYLAVLSGGPFNAR